MDKLKEIIEDLKANPLKLIGLVYPYVLVIGIGIGLVYLARINDTSRKKVMPRLPDSTVVADFEMLGERVEPAVDVKKLLVATPELVTQGEVIFKGACATCHGEGGKGDGIGGSTLNPKPRNFTSLDGWKNGPKVTNIYTTLEEGIPNSGMISYKQLKAVEKFALAHYIQSKFLPNAPKDTDADLTIFEGKYQLSKGIKVAAQIPLKNAWKISVEESKKVFSGNAVNFENDKDAGALILKRIVKNKEAALHWLVNNSQWKISEHNLRAYLTRNIYQNGFGKQIQYLDNEEWTKLFEYLVKKV